MPRRKKSATKKSFDCDPSDTILAAFCDHQRGSADGVVFYVIEKHHMVVECLVETGEALIDALCDGYSPDVIVFNPSHPHLFSVLELIERISAVSPRSRLVAYTEFPSAEQCRELMQAGVNCYVSKSAPIAVLVEAIERAKERKNMIEESMAHALVDILHIETSASLTDREREVLLLTIQGKTNDEISEALIIKESTVKSYLAKIFQKYAVTNRTELAISAIKQGIVSPSLLMQEVTVGRKK